ncbi:MAG TPA: hypothetical protein VKV35_04845 [Streptosporangiaceae bacterium]|jgi:hypothetical protein|nr:hypothetical protein [Streptosporangiaceae bacterium]
MTSQDHNGGPRRMSRRVVLRGAATAGAAGLAATAMAAAGSPAMAGTSQPQPGRQPHRDGGAGTSAGPIVVHVRNARSGDIELFSGTSQTRLRDKDLAARIARAAG